MPSDASLVEQAQEFKSQGNDAFSKGKIEEAISLYSQGLVAVDRVVDISTAKLVKTTLLSNRAMCYLKGNNLSALPKCIEDCTAGLALDPSDTSMRNKLLFRRAKAQFLNCNLPPGINAESSSNSNNKDTALQDAAMDLLTVLQTDPKNKDAAQLLTAVRAQHKAQQATAATPTAKALQSLRNSSNSNPDDLSACMHQIKILLNLLDNDLKNGAMELGRLGGATLLLDMVRQQQSTTSSSVADDDKDKLTRLCIQCLSQAASHPTFARDYLVQHQQDLLALLQPAEKDSKQPLSAESVVLVLAVMVRIILHADRDDPNQDIAGKTKLDYKVYFQAVATALNYYGNTTTEEDNKHYYTIVRAVIDMIGTWTCGVDRDATIRQSLQGASGTTTLVDPTLPVPKTQAEIRAFTPQELAAHRRRQSDQRDRDEAWAFERSVMLLSTQQAGGFNTLLQATCRVQDHVVRRELIVTIGRLLAVLDEEERIKKVVKPYLQAEGQDDDEGRNGPIIEEVFDEDEKMAAEDEEVVATLDQMMQRAIITCALLLSKKEVGAWALGTGWKTSSDELTMMVESNDPRAMCLTSEVVSAAATVEASRDLVTQLQNSGVMKTLLQSRDRDIRSGAASAVAKLGMSNKEAQKDEGEVMGMLQAACDLLEDDDNDDKEGGPSGVRTGTDNNNNNNNKLRHFSSYATSSVERGVEMISYLIYSTVAKEELAAGFQPRPESTQSSLERLVKTADLPNAGESLTGFALATIFQNMAATNLQLRKEGFEGKEVTMEQYDEMQKLGKTEEEKEVMESQQDPDTTASCNERIRKMAAANVPRAMVTLIEGEPSEHTLEQVVMGLTRMGTEPSARGLLIQQGVLTACIKIEKNEGPTETDTMKKVIQWARHCIAKVLVTTNPSLLTSAQRLGAIRPLIQLVRDIKSSDLQKFEALLSLTNLAGSGEDAQTRLVSERGIASLHFAMFSNHEMVRRAATEAMSNLVPHQAMMDHLSEAENLKLWLAFASDYEDENYACARAAAGCLAMATQDQSIAQGVVELEKFRSTTEMLLECGRLEIMHRTFAMIHNLVAHGGVTREKTIAEGLVTFCEGYVTNYHNNETDGLEFSEQERALLPVTVDLAMRIVRDADD